MFKSDRLAKIGAVERPFDPEPFCGVAKCKSSNATDKWVAEMSQRCWREAPWAEAGQGIY